MSPARLWRPVLFSKHKTANRLVIQGSVYLTVYLDARLFAVFSLVVIVVFC